MINEARIAAEEERVMDTGAKLGYVVLEALGERDLGGCEQSVSVG